LDPHLYAKNKGSLVDIPVPGMWIYFSRPV